jgi:hypothetical protein
VKAQTHEQQKTAAIQKSVNIFSNAVLITGGNISSMTPLQVGELASNLAMSQRRLKIRMTESMNFATRQLHIPRK